ncbi:RNA-directed DNA polymerase from mobile element jockey-like [Brachionus plicatilis]|uniref:RNA-directed DNA polymerase from mobile element jockey-like n=1 Tax=Brachionus plicatilis TaxID=10195 RepID=A0A3M7RBW2_BRAPC|nr:RNA-directed DNA polymerase from mobile element jockey-like [Brachionus plicatilis]
MIEEIKERCNSRLNLIKILSNKKWGLDLNTLGNLYKSLIGSIQDYSFPCLNSLSETNIKSLEVIQNSEVRSILKLRYDSHSNILHNEAYNKLKLLTVSNRLFELSERYVRTGLSHSVPLTVRLVEEYNRGFESIYIEYPTPLFFNVQHFGQHFWTIDLPRLGFKSTSMLSISSSVSKPGLFCVVDRRIEVEEDSESLILLFCNCDKFI